METAWNIFKLQSGQDFVTDARGKKQYTSPYPKGRRHKYQNPSSSGRGYIAFGADLISTGVPIQGCVCGEGGGGGEYLEQNRFKNRHNWHARSNGGKKKARGPWWSYIAHLSKQLCILTVEVSAKSTALKFLYKFYNPAPQWPCFFHPSWWLELNSERGSPKEQFCCNIEIGPVVSDK